MSAAELAAELRQNYATLASLDPSRYGRPEFAAATERAIVAIESRGDIGILRQFAEQTKLLIARKRKSVR